MLNADRQPGPPFPAGEWYAPDQRLNEAESARILADAADFDGCTLRAPVEDA